MYQVTQNKTVCVAKGNVKHVARQSSQSQRNCCEVPPKLQQWEVVFNPKNSPNGEDIENIDPSPSNVSKSLRLFGRDDVIVGEVYEMLASSFKTFLLHISTKRIQAEEFEKDKADPTKRTHQIDYAMAYQCMYQDEVSDAL